MKYKLLVILLVLSTITNAQKVWDKEAYHALCKKELNEVLVHIYDLVIDGKLAAYQNDSMVSKIQMAEFEERHEVIWIQTIQDYRSPYDPYAHKDTLLIEYLNPNVNLIGFGIIINQSINTTESTTNNTLGINLIFHPVIEELILGLVNFCSIKWQDLEAVLSKNELEKIRAYIKTANLEGINRYLNKQIDSMDELAYQKSWRLSYQDNNQIRITSNWQNAITNYWFNQYVNAAHLASNNGKKGYKDAHLKKRFDNLEKTLIDTFEIDVKNSNLPSMFVISDSILILIQQYKWVTEQISFFKTPKGEFVMGFKATKLWFYMKLEDLLPYLPKEVLPSLELLKKEI